MQVIDAQTLAQEITEILRRVRDEGETFDVVEQGQVVARLAPAKPTPDDIAESLAIIDDIERLAAEIARHTPDKVDAVEVVRDVRGDLCK